MITDRQVSDAHEEAIWVLDHALLRIDTGEGLLRARRAAAMRNLYQLHVLREVIEQRVRENVAVAREAGSLYYDYGAPSWADIGEALGVSKQAAQARYSDKKRAD